jgi:hypothetical protein
MPFLVSKSGPEIQRTLNEIANLDLIDTTMANLNGSKLKTSAEINDINEKLKSYETKLKKLEFVDQIKEKSISLKKLNTDTEIKNGKYVSLLNTITSTRNYKDQINYLLKCAESYRNLKTIIDHINTQKVKENTLEAILGTIESINSVTLRLADLTKSQKKYGGLKNLEKQAFEIHNRKVEVIHRKSILEGIKYKEGQIKEVQGIIPKLEKIVEDSYIELGKLIGDKCPVCGTRKGEVRE